MLGDQIEQNRIRPEEENLTASRLLTLVNLDEEFANNPDARIINNGTLIAKKPSKEFTDAIYSNCDGELGFVPSCRCGATRGTTKEGVTCPLCGTKCSSQFVDHLSHIAWLGIPENMAPVMHPVWYAVLKDWTSIGKRTVSVIDIILNPEEDIPDDLAPYIHGRGFKYLYENIDSILDDMQFRYPRTCKKPKAANIGNFRKFYRDCMFTRHLPILHNSLHPRKSNGDTLSYVDESSKSILTAVNELSAECFHEHATVVSEKQMNIKMYGIFKTTMEYYQQIIKDKLGGKPGLLRKHDFGSRIHFSLRTVVVPQDHVVPMDEVILPWGVIVNGLKLPILNYLVHRKYKSLEDALDIFMHSLTNYDPLIDECVETFIKESPGGRLCVAIGRNPTLAYGSIMQLYVREYKKDPHDETLALNASVCGPGNIDFDGKV